MKRNFLIYLTILSTCLLSGVLILLTGHHLKVFRSVNEWTLEKITESENGVECFVDDYNGKARQIELFCEIDSVPIDPPLTLINFNLNSEILGMSVPPKASDVALLFEELRTAKIKNLHLTTQFHREQDEAEFNFIIQNVFSPTNEPAFENILIPLEFTRVTKDLPLPGFLDSSSLPIEVIKGDCSALPAVNKLIHSPFDGVNFKLGDVIPKSVKFGFASLDIDVPTPDKTYLLAKWQNRILFNQLLLSAMVLHDVPPEQLTITPGKHITFGKGLPKIPIDKFGCTRLPSEPDQTIAAIEVDLLVVEEDKNKALKQAQPDALILSSPTPEVSIQLIPQPYQKIKTLFQIPSYSTVAHYRRLPTWLEACVLVELTLICAALYSLIGANRHLSYGLLLLSLWPLVSILQIHTGYWFPLAPPLFIVLIGWILSLHMSTKWSLRRPSSKLNVGEKKELARFD